MAVTQTLFLLRHAEAEPWFPGVKDIDRPLSEQGTAYLRRLAQWALGRIDPPQLVLCSTANRTRQTLDALRPGWIGAGTQVRWEPDIYEATTGRLHGLAETGFRVADRLMLVGHNPGLEYLLRMLVAENGDDKLGSMAPGSLAVIEFTKGWNGPDRGAVRHWLTQTTLG